MSAKRRAQKELSRDNWDHQSEEEEDNNELIMANKADLQNRKILTAKRRSGSNAYTTPINTPNKINYSTNSNREHNKEYQNIDSLKEQPNKIASSDHSTHKINGDSALNSNIDLENKDKEIIEHYYQCLEKLNMTIYEWLAKCVKSTPRGDMSPIFTNYFKHIQELKDKFSIECMDSQDNVLHKIDKFDPQPFWTTNSINTKPNSQSLISNDALGSGFFTPSSSTSLKSETIKPFSTKNSTNGGFTFQNNVDFAKSSDMFNKGSYNQSSHSFPFATTTAYSFSFNNSTSTNTSFGSNFSFKPTVTKAPVGTEGTTFLIASQGETETTKSPPPDHPDHNEPSDYVPPCGINLPAADPDKPSWDEVGAFYVKRCKLYRKGDGPQFVEAGLGFVYVKANTSNSGSRSNQLLVRADNASGTILLNAAIPPNTPITLSGKNGVLVVASVSNGNNEVPKPSTFLIRVKTTEDAKELREALLTNHLE